MAGLLTDEACMERLQQGQTEALDELYQRYARKLYAFCHNTLRSSKPHAAEDLVQDVFVRVIKGAHTFDPRKASFRTWLFRIARNRCLDVIRREKLVRMIPIGGRARQPDGAERLAREDTLADQDQDLERMAMRTVAVEAVRACVEEIDDVEERQAIVLYYLGGKVYREIGEILGRSTGTARNRVQSAQDKIRRCLEGKGIHSPP